MAAPIARVRVRRPAHTELPVDTSRRFEALRGPGKPDLATPQRRPSTSMIETSPFRHPSGPSLGLATPPEPGEAFGQYMVYEQLGEGGMARVHRAEVVGAAGFRKTVALKRMRTNTSENPDFVTSFIHEGHLIGKLKHPNIAQAYELGKIEGTYYIAMEFVPGPNLAQVLSQSRRSAGAIPLPIVLEILIQLCDALEYAHDFQPAADASPLNLIHRDISPMNIIVSRAGTVKLIDFGIAKIRGSCVETQAGIIKGKHAYVAPEYTLGTGLDRRVDLWGLGVVAHEMITGRRLFLGENEGETIRNVRLMEIQPPSRIANHISPELDDIVMTALQRDPDQRWQNAGAMRAALTAEARRQRAVVSGAQIRDWIEWAFRQPTRESPMRHVLDDLEPSISIEMHSVDVSGEISRPSMKISDPDDVPTVDAAKPPTKIVISRDVLPLSAIPRLETARAPRATTPIQLVRSQTAIPSLAIPEHTKLQRPHATPPVPAPVVLPRAPSPRIADAEAIPELIAPAGTYKIPRRAPRWNPPTRWAREEQRTPWPQLFVLGMLLVFAAMAGQLGWIDLDAWRQLLEI